MAVGRESLGCRPIADRVAQTVVAEEAGAKVEPIFHPDSYGYRPGRSALDAVAACGSGAGRRDWVIDLDIQKFFDSVVTGTHGQGGGGPHRSAVGGAVCASGGSRADAAARRDAGRSGIGVPRRGPRSRRCWPTCSCTMRSMRGWPGSSRACGSNAMPTTRSCTASPNAKPARCWPRSGTGWNRSGCGCIPTRRGSSTARTGKRRGSTTGTRRLRSWGTRFGTRAARGKNGQLFVSFCPRSATTP